jgi:hypothetical protein
VIASEFRIANDCEKFNLLDRKVFFASEDNRFVHSDVIRMGGADVCQTVGVCGADVCNINITAIAKRRTISRGGINPIRPIGDLELSWFAVPCILQSEQKTLL